MSVGTVAKKKAGGEPAAKAGQSRVRTAVLMIRGTPEWKAWVEGLMEFDRAPSLNDLTDRAYVSYARQIGYTKVAPKR